MELSFNTTTVDVSVALRALKLYRAGLYAEAIADLLDILDIEANNWDARVMLGASYYKTGQYAAAHRAFRLVYDRCTEPVLHQKATEGMKAAQAKLERRPRFELPAEFGATAARLAPKTVAWLD